MDSGKPANEIMTQGAAPKSGRGDRRRRWDMTSADVRYFLPKPGTSADKPELGREVTNEAEVLVEAFKKDQPFFTLVAWRAVSESEDGIPRIVKEAVRRT